MPDRVNAEKLEIVEMQKKKQFRIVKMQKNFKS